jgi:hypothetical protein
MVLGVVARPPRRPGAVAPCASSLGTRPSAMVLGVVARPPRRPGVVVSAASSLGTRPSAQALGAQATHADDPL